MHTHVHVLCSGSHVGLCFGLLISCTQIHIPHIPLHPPPPPPPHTHTYTRCTYVALPEGSKSKLMDAMNKFAMAEASCGSDDAVALILYTEAASE